MSSIIMPRGIIKPPGLVLDLPMQGEQLGQVGDLFDPGAGGFETDTGSWTANDNNTIEVSTDEAHGGSRSLKITFVDSSIGANLILRESTDIITDLTVGKKYRLILWGKLNTGAADIRMYDGANWFDTQAFSTSAMTKHTFEFICQHATICQLGMQNMGAGEIIYIDDLTLQELYTPDVSGLGIHGRVNGATVAQGLHGGCYSFTTDDYISLPQTIYRTTGYGIGMWVKADYSVNTNKRIYAEGNSGNDTPFWALSTHSTAANAKLFAYLRDDSSTIRINVVYSTTDVFDDLWHYIFWNDLNGAAELYVDGVLDATDYSYTPGAITLDRATLGAQGRIGYDSFLTGSIGRTKLFDRILTQPQIQYEMYREAPLKPVMNGGVLWPV